MKRKLKRSHRSVFGRRSMPPALKTLLWIVTCVTVVALGYFGAKLTSENRNTNTDVEVNGGDIAHTAPSTDAEDTDTLDDTTPDHSTDDTVEADGIRAFYLPTSEMSADSLADTALLQDAKAAGFTAVVFDLKDAEGTLYYNFSCAQAKKVNAYAPNAMTADQLTALFSLIREAGLQPIPRLYAFRDNLGAKALADARVALDSNHNWGWYDGDPNNGGRRWLNPYSDAAHAYIGALVSELKDMGAAAIMLDGVEFPARTDSAYFGEDATTISKSDILTTFVTKTRTLLGEDCPLILSCTAESALGTETKVYGGNPLTFGTHAVSPRLTTNVKESVEKMILRTQVLDPKPSIIPTLVTDGLTTTQINEILAACIEGGTSEFILLLPEGNYDLSVYTLP